MKKHLFFFVLLFSCSVALFPNEGVSIRPAKEEDVDTLYDLICELALFEGKDIASLPLTKENLLAFGFGERPYFFVQIAELEENIVGYALYFYGFSGHKGHPTLYIDDLYVKDQYRGKGIGTQLLKQLTSDALQHECCRLEWLVFDWNAQAMKFYQSLGADLRKDLILVRLEKGPMERLTKD